MARFFGEIIPHEGDVTDSVRWRLNRLESTLPLLPKTFAEKRSESELPDALRPRNLVNLAERCFTAGNYLRAFQYQLFLALLGLFQVNLDVNDLIQCMTRALYYLRRNQTVDLLVETKFLERMADWLAATFAPRWGDQKPEPRSYLLSLEELASWLNERGHPKMALPLFEKHESIIAVNKGAYRDWEITRLERQKAHMYENLFKLTKATYCLDVAVELSEADQNQIPIRQVRDVDLPVLHGDYDLACQNSEDVFHKLATQTDGFQKPREARLTLATLRAQALTGSMMAELAGNFTDEHRQAVAWCRKPGEKTLLIATPFIRRVLEVLKARPTVGQIVEVIESNVVSPLRDELARRVARIATDLPPPCETW